MTLILIIVAWVLFFLFAVALGKAASHEIPTVDAAKQERQAAAALRPRLHGVTNIQPMDTTWRNS